MAKMMEQLNQLSKQTEMMGKMAAGKGRQLDSDDDNVRSDGTHMIDTSGRK